ncbi:hypothetical protein IMF27_24775 [Pseudomonas sp. PCH199]|uniref:hypothetical protein n=1 Tax=unclassified Pseudomonas TaxID=196821 RepID=UPI000BC68770|nr:MULTISPECIES: hypothetical protein [unclassified Pseudomonas]MCW8278386.1 hypothetical protein [Pseudomonas sp. PCH199]PAM81494.1 hypothetical protein CES87_25290 [Pseudomonas sp. ERMR1:02]
MGMKPPKKVAKPNTPDANQPVRNASAEDATTPRLNLPETGISEPTTSSSGSRRPESESDNIPREPQVTVADVSPSGESTTSTGGATSDINFLPSLLVATLSAPLANGLRHGKRQTTYAEIENEGITLVRLSADGEYQASSANELNASGPVLERIAGTTFWRRKNTDIADDQQPASSTDEQPGPSTRKRPRLDEGAGNLAEKHPLLVELLLHPTSPLDLSSALW